MKNYLIKDLVNAAFIVFLFFAPKINTAQSTWVQEATFPGPIYWINDIWGTDNSNVWAVGDNEKIYYYNGSTWAEQASGVFVDLEEIWGSAPNDVYAVGGGSSSGSGVIVRYNGSTWSPVALPSEPVFPLKEITGLNANHIIAGGVVGFLANFGSGWQFANPPWSGGLGSQGDVFALNENAMWYSYSYGFYDNIYKCTSQGCTQQIHLEDDHIGIIKIHGFDESNILAVGGGGRIYRYNGSTWNLEEYISDISYFSELSLISPNNIVASGQGAGGFYSYHYNGTSWNKIWENDDMKLVQGIGNTFWGYKDQYIYRTNFSGMVDTKEEGLENQINNVFPNPTHSDIYFRETIPLENSFEIFDLNGMLVETGMITGQQLNISHLTAGTYFIKIYSEKKIQVNRIIKF